MTRDELIEFYAEPFLIQGVSYSLHFPWGLIPYQMVECVEGEEKATSNIYIQLPGRLLQGGEAIKNQMGLSFATNILLHPEDLDKSRGEMEVIKNRFIKIVEQGLIKGGLIDPQ